MGAKKPNGWNRVKLSEIIQDLPSGVSVNGEDRPATSGELGVLKVSSVSNGRFYPIENKIVVPKDVDRARMPVSRGDLLISRSNTFDLVGASGMAMDDFPNLFLPDKLWKVVLRDETRDRLDWLLHLLNSSSMRQSLKNIATGTSGSMKNISKPSFLSIRVLRPTFPEQQKIAVILSTWDRAIELTEKLIAAKQRRKQALMQQLLTGKVRLPGFEKSKWEVVELGSLGKLASGGTPSKQNPDFWNGVVPWVTAKDLKRPRLTDSIDHVTNQAVGKGTKLAPAGSIMILVRGMTLLKNVPICLTEVPMCFNQDIRALTVSSSHDSRFVAYSLSNAKGKLMSLVNVAGHGTGRLATELLVELTLRIPTTREEQSPIADLIEAADNEIELLERRLARVRQQKLGLMQQLLTGKSRLTM